MISPTLTETIPLLDLRREYSEIAEDLHRAWEQVLSRMILVDGPEVTAFEREIAAYTGASYACGVGCGTDALALGLAACGVGPGDRVVLAANAFAADVEAIRCAGGIPVLVDIEADSLQPSLDELEAAMPVRAVLLVHLHGRAFDAAAVREICDRHGALLVEDGSHSHGARRHDRHAGTMGRAGCFSAGIVKNLNAYGDAGFVITDDRAVDTRIRLLQRHGQERKNEHVIYGRNSRLDELHAATLRIKLRRLDARNERRRRIAAFYDEQFAPLDVMVLRADPGETPVYHQYVLRTEARDALARHLRESGIATGVHYPVPLHRQPAWRETYGEHRPLPEAERAARTMLSIPVFPELSDVEVEHIARSVRAFFR